MPLSKSLRPLPLLLTPCPTGPPPPHTLLALAPLTSFSHWSLKLPGGIQEAVQQTDNSKSSFLS